MGVEVSDAMYESSYADRLSAAMHDATLLAGRLKGRHVKIRKGFFDPSRSVDAPPQAGLMARAGRLHLPVKVELLALWAAGSKGRSAAIDGENIPLGFDGPEPYTTPCNEAGFASILAVPGTYFEAKRAVRRALDLLAGTEETPALIEFRDGGRYIRLLREDGSGTAYFDPGDPTEDAGGRAEGHYVKLPSTFFTNGWIAALPSYAIATMLFYAARSPAEGTDLEEWLARNAGPFANDTLLADFGGLSRRTHDRGVALLSRWGLLATKKRRIRSNSLRFRHHYVLNYDGFRRRAPDVPAPANPALSRLDPIDPRMLLPPLPPRRRPPTPAHLPSDSDDLFGDGSTFEEPF